MSVLSKLNLSAMTGRSGRSGKDVSQPPEAITAAMAGVSLLSDDPYVSRSSTLDSSQTSLEREADLGTLIIVIMKAKNLHNRRALSKQNPYCSVRIGVHNDRTHVITRGGQSPVWDHETRFQLSSDDDVRSLKLCVFDQNGNNTEIIGDAHIPLQQALERPPQQGFDDWFPIKFNNRYVGEVYLEMTFYPSKRQSRRSSCTPSLSSSLSASQSTSQSRSVSPSRSANRFSTRSTPPLKPYHPLLHMPHSESMPALVGPTPRVLPQRESTPEYRVLPGHNPYGGSADLASRSSSCLKLSGRQASRPLPKLPPHLHHSTPSVDRAQADISKQINEGYEASLLEKLMP